jgi:YNFM family putative membrane transporter
MLALASAATGIVLSLSMQLWLVIVGLALLTGGLFVVQALALGVIGAAVPRARSSAVGLYVTTFYVGGAIGGVAPAGLWHAFGWPGVVGLILAVLALMAALGAIAWHQPAS